MTELDMATLVRTEGDTATVFAGDYLNKLSGELIERECRSRIAEGCKQIVVNFAKTEVVNSIGISILLGVIDSAKGSGARVILSELNDNTVELFDMLGVTKHAELA